MSQSKGQPTQRAAHREFSGDPLGKTTLYKTSGAATVQGEGWRAEGRRSARGTDSEGNEDSLKDRQHSAVTSYHICTKTVDNSKSES